MPSNGRRKIWEVTYVITASQQGKLPPFCWGPGEHHGAFGAGTVVGGWEQLAAL